ncbi:hypothetical protein [Sporomusa acidovorans]|uniref:hypothetical protein n=1 Tax=Sporomusa acidovorans TaxID=112900 RepID=UPI00088BE93A|nr:hypothetical protein [Sporomusa acidovorans]OZC19077.1 N-succinyldiaminopimelate aminotransferase [Sporomusa acidovorans DSM 3132]SDD66485.1 hypothetical protein SAMN04488499_100323 [Sporomusa acidovorans]
MGSLGFLGSVYMFFLLALLVVALGAGASYIIQTVTGAVGQMAAAPAGTTVKSKQLFGGGNNIMENNQWLRYALYSFLGILLLLVIGGLVAPNQAMYGYGQYGQMPMGNMNMGQMPMGNMNMGQMPMGNMNMGQMPMGNMNMGQMPMGNMNMGQMPMGNMNMGQMPMGNMNMGQMPMGNMNMGQMPMGNMNMGQMQGGGGMGMMGM